MGRGIERLGAAVLVAGALYAAKDSTPVFAGGCVEPSHDILTTVKSTKNYELIKVGFQCGTERSDPSQSNVIRIKSKTKFLGIPFLWTTTDGSVEGLRAVVGQCDLIGEDLQSKKYMATFSEFDVVASTPDCLDK